MYIAVIIIMMNASMFAIALIHKNIFSPLVNFLLANLNLSIVLRPFTYIRPNTQDQCNLNQHLYNPHSPIGSPTVPADPSLSVGLKYAPSN